MDLALHDKVVLITGAAGGIGRVLTRLFAQEGAKVVIHYGFAREEPEALKLAAELGAQGLALQADLSIESEACRVFTEALAWSGRIDVLVNNAGLSPYEGTAVPDHTPAMWEELFRANLLTAVLCTKEYLKAARSQRAGNVIYLSSTAGLDGEAGNAIYAAMKSALVGLCLSVKQEGIRLLPSGSRFRANVVAPGWTITQMPAVQKFLQDRAAVIRALQTRSIPELAEAEDVARAVLFLASDKASRAITGQVLRIDCGMDRRLQWEADELQARYEQIRRCSSAAEGATGRPVADPYLGKKG